MNGSLRIVPPRLHFRRFLAFACAAVAVCPAARALERVTLSNGFSYDCVRSETLSAGQVRLYLSETTAGASSANYIDLPAERIASVERLPDAVASTLLPPSGPDAQPQRDTPARPDTRTLLAHAGTAHNIDAELLASVVHAESGGRATAVSHSGARGLMQLMPGTARDVGVQDAFEPEQNINGGTAYLDLLLSRYHDDLALALAAYNAGPAAVDRFHGIPPFRETRLYVARVMTEFKRRKLALQNAAAGAVTLAQGLASKP